MFDSPENAGMVFVHHQYTPRVRRCKAGAGLKPAPCSGKEKPGFTTEAQRTPRRRLESEGRREKDEQVRSDAVRRYLSFPFGTEGHLTAEVAAAAEESVSGRVCSAHRSSNP